jgi:hypothetical protein
VIFLKQQNYKNFSFDQNDLTAMSDSQLPNKRRRLNRLSNVNKPFKSPLRAPLVSKQPNVQSPLVPGSAKPKTAQADDSVLIPSTASARQLDFRLSRSSPTKPSSRLSTSTSQPQKTSEIKLLEAAIRVAKTDIQTLTQAVSILSASKQSMLADLGSKWKEATRTAADQVFDQAKDKVEGMGGFKSWKAMQAESVASWGRDDGRVRPRSDEDDDRKEGNNSEVEDEEDCVSH